MKTYVNFCGIVMPSEKNNIIKFNRYVKSNKMTYITKAGIESFV